MSKAAETFKMQLPRTKPEITGEFTEAESTTTPFSFLTEDVTGKNVPIGTSITPPVLLPSGTHGNPYEVLKKQDFSIHPGWLARPDQLGRTEGDVIAQTLDRWDIALHKGTNKATENKQLALKLRHASLLADTDVQTLLNQVYDAFYRRYGTNAGLISVIKAARNAGFYLRAQDLPLFLNAIKTAGIPIGHYSRKATWNKEERILHYYFASNAHLDRITQVFETDESLLRFKKHTLS